MGIKIHVLFLNNKRINIKVDKRFDIVYLCEEIIKHIINEKELFIASITMIIAITCIGLRTQKQEAYRLSDISMQNIEALAGNETVVTIPCVADSKQIDDTTHIPQNIK